MLLGDIAHVKTGLVLSRKKPKLAQDTKIRYNLLTLNNINEDGLIFNEIFDEFHSYEELDEHYFTEKDDILLRLSQPFTSVYIDEKHTGLLTPSYFATIKVNDNRVLPQFLAWYLNTKYVKHELERSQSGSRILATNQQAIKNIPIKLPSMTKQKAIIELYELHLKEKNLYKKLVEEKEILFQGIAQQLLGGKKND